MLEIKDINLKDRTELTPEEYTLLAATISEYNRTISFWDKPDDCPYEKLQLVSTEVAEATEGERKNLMDDKIPTRKMAEVELADCMIRILSFMGSNRWIYPTLTQELPPNDVFVDSDTVAGYHLSINVEICELAKLIACPEPDQVQKHRVRIQCVSLVESIVRVANICKYDVFGALEEKFYFNQTREDHTLEAREQETGKSF